MALDVNGYNSVFKSFVDFAQERIDANQAKAVADASVKPWLSARGPRSRWW